MKTYAQYYAEVEALAALAPQSQDAANPSDEGRANASPPASQQDAHSQVRVAYEHLRGLVARCRELEQALELYALPEHIWVRSAALAVDKGYTARAVLGKEKE
jgi:hypothetical protein